MLEKTYLLLQFSFTSLFNVLEVFPVYMDKFSRTNCSIMAPTVYENKTIKLTKACSNSSIDASVKYKLNPSTHPETLITMRFVMQNGKAQGMMKSLNEGNVFPSNKHLHLSSSDLHHQKC